MQEQISNLIESIKLRFTNPFISAFIIAWSILNASELYLLIYDTRFNPSQRLNNFIEADSKLLIAAAYAAIYPIASAILKIIADVIDEAAVFAKSNLLKLFNKHGWVEKTKFNELFQLLNQSEASGNTQAQENRDLKAQIQKLNDQLSKMTKDSLIDREEPEDEPKEPKESSYIYSEDIISKKDQINDNETNFQDESINQSNDTSYDAPPKRMPSFKLNQILAAGMSIPELRNYISHPKLTQLQSRERMTRLENRLVTIDGVLEHLKVREMNNPESDVFVVLKDKSNPKEKIACHFTGEGAKRLQLVGYGDKISVSGKIKITPSMKLIDCEVTKIGNTRYPEESPFVENLN